MPVHIIVKNTRTMDMTIDQQVALDEALVPHASRLRIGKSNFRLKSDISSKESTLQLFLRLTPFYKAFLVIANVLEIYMEILHICLRLPGQTFDELPFKEEIMAFLRFLGHSGEIRRLTDVNINKLHQPWRSFTAIINKCLSRKSTGYDSLRDDQMFTMIKLVSRHQNTQQFGAMLPIELTNEDIRNSEAYKKYYAVATGAAPPKTKENVKKMKSSPDITVTPPTAAAGADEGTGFIPGVPDVPTEESDEEISWKLSDEEDDDVDKGSDNKDDDDVQDDDDDQDDDNQDDDDQDEGDKDDDQDESNDDDQDSDEEGEEFIHLKLSIHDDEETKDEERFDPIAKTPENSNDKGNDEESLGLNVGREEGQDEEDDEDELYRDVNINLEGRIVQMAGVHTTQEFEDTHVTLTPVNPDDNLPDGCSSSNHSGPSYIVCTNYHPSTIATISTVPQAPTPPTTDLSTLLQDLPNTGSLFGFDHRLKTLEANFSEFMQTNQFAEAVSSIPGIVQRYMDQQMNEAVNFAEAVSSIPGIVQRYMDQQMNEAVNVAVQIQSDRLCNEAQAKNEEFLKNLDENIQKIIKENLYKALVEAYESDKIILDTYEDVVILKRRRDDDADKDEEPSAGSDRGSKRRRELKEPESTSAPKEKATRTTGKST
nr:hypothetical protein [Tanacetum cinerariifolium]